MTYIIQQITFQSNNRNQIEVDLMKMSPFRFEKTHFKKRI